MVEFDTGIIFFISIVAVFFAFWIGNKVGALKRDRYWEAEIPGHRRDAINKSRAVLGGHFSENLAPFLPDFPFSPTECRFVGKPVDFIVFRGMDNKTIEEVVFVEVKSGDSKLSPQEKNLKEAINNKKVRFVEYRVDQSITKKNDFDG